MKKKTFLDYLVWGKPTKRTNKEFPNLGAGIGGKLVKGKTKAIQYKNKYKKQFPDMQWFVRQFK